jgi:hypothetical protein
MKFFKTAVSVVFCLGLVYSVSGQTTSTQDTSRSPRDFVQTFYSWYVPRALKRDTVLAALKYKNSMFSPEVVLELREDAAAQSKAANEIVGLDSDPFLNSQDPDEYYETGKITQSGPNYFVEVYGVSNGKRRAKPDVVPELTYQDARWLFVNFHYPDEGDLLRILKVLRENRQKIPK